jgi:hypothetical protein
MLHAYVARHDIHRPQTEHLRLLQPDAHPLPPMSHKLLLVIARHSSCQHDAWRNLRTSHAFQFRHHRTICMVARDDELEAESP